MEEGGLEADPGGVEHRLEGLLVGEDVGDGGERDGHGGGGGRGGGGVGGEPDEAVGSENEEAGLEGGEGWEVFTFEVHGGDKRALDLVREEHRPAATRLLHRGKPLPTH